MGAIAHYLEERGLPTTSISLVRENTVLIRPPRALWVPFPLGRPFGAPNEPAFQTRVLRAALALLERPDGPVILEDFPDDAPGQSAADPAGEAMVCPVSFPAPPSKGEPALLDRVLGEIASLAPWHSLFLASHGGRSGANASGLTPEDNARLIAGFVATGEGPSASGDFAVTLRNAAVDLQAWYAEAMASRPGQSGSPGALADWFWGETAAGSLLLALHPACLASGDARVRQVGLGQLVPRAQKHRLGG